MKLNSDTIKKVPVKRRISVGDFQISAEESRFSRKLLREELERNGIENRPLFGCVLI